MEKIGVIGCGTMGHSIALNAAWAGFEVIMQGVDSSDLERGNRLMLEKLDVLIENDLVTSDEGKMIVKRIEQTTKIENVAKYATFIIEAIPENIELKQAIFKRLDYLCTEDIVLASNTSALSPTDIAALTNHPERVVIAHFWHPAHLIPLVEIVRGEKTNDVTVNKSLEVMKQMNKKPIEVKKEAPGFVGNRLQFALLREAQHILEEGIATKEDIDAAVTYSIGRRLPITGPILSADMGGLDVYTDIANYLNKDLSTKETAAESMEKLVENNKFGNKTGEGYYKWDKITSEKINKLREEELIKYLKKDLELS